MFLMQPSVVIVGTSHTYQAGGKDCTNNDATLLRNLFLNACREWNLRGIAEEMNNEWLVSYQSVQSLPCQVATVLGLSHHYCDPNTSERIQAGIINSGNILLDAKLNGLSEDEKTKRLLIEEIKREQYWLSELQKQDIWPTLFVCGPNHVLRFKSLLDSVGYVTHILVQDWSPKTTIGQAAQVL
jgi:hypothetical protein